LMMFLREPAAQAARAMEAEGRIDTVLL
jgi:hypothetical protein